MVAPTTLMPICVGPGVGRDDIVAIGLRRRAADRLAEQMTDTLGDRPNGPS